MADIVYDGTTLPDAYVGVPYKAKIATHAAASIITASSITVGALPAGLALGSAAGAFDEITGTPTKAGVAVAFTVSLTDTAGAVTNAMTMNVFVQSEAPGNADVTPFEEVNEVGVIDSEWPVVS